MQIHHTLPNSKFIPYVIRLKLKMMNVWIDSQDIWTLLKSRWTQKLMLFSFESDVRPQHNKNIRREVVVVSRFAPMLFCDYTG